MAGVFAERVAAVLGDGLVGVYLVGSYALRDLQARSDVDFVVVVRGEQAPAVVDALGKLHEWIGSTYPTRQFEGFYADADDLRRRPDVSSERGWKFLGGELSPAHGLSVVEREMLRRSGHVVVGSAIEALDLLDVSDELASFSRRNLVEYWEPWLRRTAPYFMKGPAIGPRRKQAAWAAAWCSLGVPRLYTAIVDGHIVSKTEAGRRARACFDSSWHDVIDAALDYRLRGDDADIKRLAALRDDAVTFSRHIIETALAD